MAVLPWLLREIPMAALAAVLVVTGWRLVSLSHVTHLFRAYGVLPALIWAATLVTVVSVDLLTGVLVGIALSLVELLPLFRRLGLKIHSEQQADGHAIRLEGSATFVTLPKLTAALEAAPAGEPVRIDAARLGAVDHTAAEMLSDWFARRRASGRPAVLVGASKKVAALAV